MRSLVNGIKGHGGILLVISEILHIGNRSKKSVPPKMLDGNISYKTFLFHKNIYVKGKYIAHISFYAPNRILLS